MHARSWGWCLAAVLAVAGLLSGAEGHASTIDFTNPANGVTPGTVSTRAFVIDGVTVTLTAKPEGSTLYWDQDDGYGVISTVGYEYDEIEHPEWLEVSFSAPVTLLKFWLTDFFYEDNGYYGGNAPSYLSFTHFYAECGKYRINGGAPSEFCQTDWNKTMSNSNGEFEMFVGATGVTSLSLTGLGLVAFGPWIENHEFSLAQIEFEVPNQVPEPAGLTLLVCAVAGLRAWRASWRRRAGRRHMAPEPGLSDRPRPGVPPATRGAPVRTLRPAAAPSLRRTPGR